MTGQGEAARPDRIKPVFVPRKHKSCASRRASSTRVRTHIAVQHDGGRCTVRPALFQASAAAE